MPKIFTEEQKEKLNQSLRQNCIAILKDRGYRGLNIRELTQITGISAGTFYHFYQSKEELILSLMDDCQVALQNQFLERYHTQGRIDRKTFIELYCNFFIWDENNILRYLSRDDMTTLLLRSGKQYSVGPVKDLMERNREYLKNPRKNMNLNAIINFTQLVNLCFENKDLLVAEELPDTIRTLLENMADEIFEEE